MSDHTFIRQMVAEHLLSPELGTRAEELLALSACRPDSVLLQLNALDEPTLLEALGRFHNTRALRPLDLVGIPPEVIRLLPPRAAQRYEVVPFRLDGRTLSVASLRPGDLLIEDEVALLTGCRVSSFIAVEVRLYEALATYYDAELPVTLESVSRQLAGARGKVSASHRPAPPMRHRSTTPPTVPPRAPETPLTRSPERESAGPARRPGEVELEISPEEFELFPSLSRPTTGSVTPEGEVPEPEVVAAPSGSTEPTQPTTEERLAEAASALQRAELREDIADALLDFAAHHFRRRLLLIVRKDHVVGWRGEGEGVAADTVRAISIPVSGPSVFHGLLQGAGFWLGVLPSMPRNLDLILGLGGAEPAACLVVPIALRGKVIAFLYGDNLEAGVAGAPVAELRRLANKAALAFEVYILKNKIRTA